MTNIEQAMERSARAASYGVAENNPLWMSGISHDEVRFDLGVFNLAGKDENGKFYITKIERLRLLTDRGFPWWDISYCYGRLSTSELVRVDIGVHQINKPRVGGRVINKVCKSHLIAIAKFNGRYAKSIGLLAHDGGYGDALSTLY